LKDYGDVIKTVGDTTTSVEELRKAVDLLRQGGSGQPGNAVLLSHDS